MNFPNEMSGTHPLAGWCNKLLRAAKASRLSNGVGYRTNITSDGTILKVEAGASSLGITYAGDYEIEKGYEKGTVVRKRTGTHQGFYIAFKTAAAGEEPTFPEPEDATWHLWTLGVVSTFEVTSDPAMNVKQVYIHASEPYI